MNPHPLKILKIAESSSPYSDIEQVELETEDGTIHCIFHEAAAGDMAVLWVFGSGGGLGGPAGGLYARHATSLAERSVASLRLDYRYAGHLENCVKDVLLGIQYMRQRGRSKIILVGHSFGGAVVISSGVASPAAIGVAALSSQTQGTTAVHRLSPRPLLLIHGLEDEVLPPSCSQTIYARAAEPKRLLLYPGARHGLDECREELDRDLENWLREIEKNRKEELGRGKDGEARGTEH